MRIYPGAAEILQRGDAAHVGPVGMGDDDMLQIGDLFSCPRDLIQDNRSVCIEKCVDQRQRSPVINQVRVDVTAFPLTHAVEARCYLHLPILHVEPDKPGAGDEMQLALATGRVQGPQSRDAAPGPE
ncbi:MAG TPA: hypothetical protein VN203_23325, partial [Candidatus Acidoferrum sp.]|nr:hypothetical protein [Candidatus Acidoferrum sp.]